MTDTSTSREWNMPGPIMANGSARRPRLRQIINAEKYNKTGLGEELLRKSNGGAVAYIGCNTGSQPCGLTLQRGFVEAAMQPHIRVGDAWNEALRYYHAHERLEALKPDAGWYPPSIFFQGMKFMLFGDPTIEL
jgi:hypothetical protein